MWTKEGRSDLTYENDFEIWFVREGVLEEAVGDGQAGHGTAQDEDCLEHCGLLMRVVSVDGVSGREKLEVS